MRSTIGRSSITVLSCMRSWKAAIPAILRMSIAPRRIRFRPSTKRYASVMYRWAAAFLLLAAAFAAQTLDSRLAKWKTVEMPFRPDGLSSRERQLVEKLVQACRLLDDVYWRQSDPEGLQLYKTTTDPRIKRLLMIFGSRWDLIDQNRP